jgi:hypothetical protein
MLRRMTRSLHHLLTASLVLAVAACGGGDPGVSIGPPARIEVAIGADQDGTVGSNIPISPAVRVVDANGRGVSGIAVSFRVEAGNGTVNGGDSLVTNAEGLATVGQWRLGPSVGVQQLRVQAEGFTFQALISATAKPGPPASIQIVTAGGALAAIVSQPVIPTPTVRVRDGFGNPIPGTAVSFIATLGGGTVTGGEQVTDSEGRAQVGSWTMGPVPGNNRMIARTGNGLIATFNASGLGVPTSTIAASAVDQDGVTNFGIPVLPRLQVRDQLGQGLAGVPVVFTRTLGDGVLTGDTAITNNQGIAAPRDYRLGTAPNHAVVASVIGAPGLAPVEFRATATPRAFTIDVRFVSSLTPAQRDAFIAAALKWMDVIVGDLPDVFVNRSANSCFSTATHPAVSELVDDVILFAEVVSIDGPGTILGRAGFCNRRGGSAGLPSLGHMTFDSDDLPAYEASGRLLPLILHEMGHVLGIGTLWSGTGLLQGAGGNDPIFTGVQAGLAWPQLGLSYGGAIVPVENSFGDGTRDAHWRESVLDRELMTGIIEAPGIAMPLSVLTAASLIDLGYVVDLSAAEPFAPPGLRADGTPMMTPGGTRIIEILFNTEGAIMPDGKFIPRQH